MRKYAENVSKGFGCSAFSNYLDFKDHFCGNFKTPISAKSLKIKRVLKTCAWKTFENGDFCHSFRYILTFLKVIDNFAK